MDKRLVEGIWDCKYCGQKAIGGLLKHCPACGHPQDSDTHFYMGEEIKYIDEAQANEYGQGADWICEYCGSMNRFNYKFCSNCGAPRDEAGQDYFNRKEKQINKLPDKKPEKKSGRNLKWLPIVLVVVAAIVFLAMPKTTTVTVTDKSWARTINVEEMQTVQESDWKVPEGGRVTSEKREIHHYENVVDHYETREREVAEQVLDGYDTYTTYEDNGDGTFTEETHETPRYRTEYHTETYEEPVYREEPVYAVKYYYDVDKWVVTRTVDTKGKKKSPEWGDVKLKDGEREGERIETYTLNFVNEKGKEYTANVALEQWAELNIDDEVKIHVVGSVVVKVAGEPVA